MPYTMLQNASSVWGVGGIRKTLFDLGISTSGAGLTVAAQYLTTTVAGLNVADFGAAIYNRGMWQVRFKTGIQAINIAQTLDGRGPNPNTLTGVQVCLRVSQSTFTGATTPAGSVIVDQFTLPTLAGEVHLGPRYFSSDPQPFRFARVESLGNEPNANLTFDVEIVAVP